MKKGKGPSLKRQSSASAGASGGGDEEVTIVTIDLTDQMLYLDTERTTGGRVKGSRSVLQKQKDACRSQPPVFTCRVETVGVVVSNFGDLEKQWVVEMGFGGLLYLQGKRLPRALCYWLMSRFDPVTRTLFLSGSGAGSGCIELPINVGQVHWVFGLPHGDKKVPISKKFTERVKCLKEDLLAEFGEQHQDGSRVVAMKKVVDRVEGNWRQEEELVFKTYFLVLLLGDFIAPTTSARLSPDLFTAVACVDNTNEYDWCSLLLDRLCEAGKKFAKNFYRDGFAKTCGGCTYFLAILYLDHLNIQPKSWGMFPRLKAWSNDDINKVKLDDRFPSEDGKPRKGDFGKTPCFDGAYGEGHPRLGRDSLGPHGGLDQLPLKVASAVVRAMGCQPDYEGMGACKKVGADALVDDGILPNPPRAKRRAPPVSSNPYLRTLAKRKKEGGQAGLDVGCSQTKKMNDQCSELSPNKEDGRSKKSDEYENVTFEHEALSESNATGGDNIHLNTDGGAVDVQPNQELAATTVGELGADESMKQVGNIVDELKKTMQEEEEEISDSIIVSKVNELNKELQQREEEGQNTIHRSRSPEVVEGEPLSTQSLESKDDANDCASVESKCSEAQKVDRSRKKREKREGPMLRNKEFVSNIFPRSNTHVKSKVVRFLMGCMGRRSRRCNAPENDELKNLTILQCGHMYASVANCYTVLGTDGPGVDDNYVRAAAPLYTRMWKRTYVDRSVRYMMDPMFAMRVDQERGLSSDTWESTTKRAASLAKPFVEKEMCADRFDVIFVPVLQNNHWWCASFSVNCEEIWVIDSAGLRRGAKHKDLLAKLCVAIEIFLAKVDPKWIVGSVPTWPVKVVKMEAQEDGNSCGVRMLLAIKACAERFHVEFNLRSHINEEREWLITDDLMNDLNEAKGTLKEAIDKFHSTDNLEENE